MMQSFEAMMSFLVFSSLVIAFAGNAGAPSGIDDSLLRLQLAQDAWRVLYLRGDFRDFNAGENTDLLNDMETIENETGLCVFLIGSAKYTSCRGGERHEMTSSIQRALIIGRVPRKVTFSLGK